MADESTLILNSSLYYAKPHLSQNPDYLHYWAFHAPTAIQQAWKISKMSEVKILSQAKARITQARNRQLQKIKEQNQNIDLNELKSIEQLLLKGSWLKTFNMDNIDVSSSFKLPEIEEIIEVGSGSLIKDAQAAFSKNAEALSLIEEDIISRVGCTQDDIDNYVDYVLKAYFTSGVKTINAAGRSYTTKAKGQSSVSSWQAKIIESLLSRNNEGFFTKGGKYKGAYEGWESEKGKLIAAITVLQDPQSLKYIQEVADSGKVEIKHEDGSSDGLATDVRTVLEALFDKVKKYFQQLHAIAAEAAAGRGVQSALEEFGEALSKYTLEATGENVGTGQIDVVKTANFEGNKKFFDMIQTQQKNKTAWDNANMRASKSDAYFQITKDGVVVRQGLSVKDYKSVSVSADGHIQSATIDIQKGTPLLTLLTREANLSSAQMHTLFQVLAFHTDESDEGVGSFFIANLWEDMMDKIKYLAFLDTIAGFTNELDQAMYFVFNRNIYSMWDIMGYFQKVNDYKDAIRWTAMNGGTLEYEDYHSLDTWEGTKWRANKEKAETRSNRSSSLMAQQMYDTKVEVKIHIADIAAFENLKLN